MRLYLGNLLPQGGPLLPQGLGPPQRHLQLPQFRGLPAELLRGEPLEILDDSEQYESCHISPNIYI